MKTSRSNLKRLPLAESRRPSVEALEQRTLFTVTTLQHDTDPVHAGNALRSAITSAQLGDTIILDATTTYKGGFTLPNKTSGSGWITIQSSALASLPAEGVRVGPADAANMPNLIAPGSNVPVLNTAGNVAHHYKFVGIEFIGPADNSFVQTLIEVGSTYSAQQTTVAQQPHDIIFDRTYVHPNVASATINKAFSLHAMRVDVINSYVEEIHYGGDSNAIAGYNGTGPYNILNNHLEAAGENIFFGGASNYMPSVISNVVIRGNHVIKPTSWRGVWTVKNLFELKQGSHFVVENNIFENCWESGQSGVAILLKLGDYNGSQNNGNHLNVTEDIIFRNNIVRHANGGLAFQGRDYAATNPSDPGGLVRRLLISNNVLEDINGFWGNSGTGGGTFFTYLTHGPKDITIEHNTFFNGYTTVEIDTSNASWPATNFVYKNNIVAHNDYGFRSTNGTGDIPITTYFGDPGAMIKGNVFMDDKAKATLYDNEARTGNNAPNVRTINSWPTSWANVGFVNMAGGNYRLTASASTTYRAKTTDALDPGANIDRLDAALAGVISGNWAFANATGPQLFVHFDGSGTPITLGKSGSNITVTKNGQTLSFGGITQINIVDSNFDDTLELGGSITQPIVPTNGSGNDLMRINSGTYTFASDLSLSSQYWNVKDWAVSVAAGATAVFNSNQTLRSLSVDGTATLPAGGAKVLRVGDLQVNGKLDLADNALIWDYAAGTPIGAWTGGNVYNGLTGLVAAGRNGGAWNGNGLITSRSNAAGGSAKTTLGIAEAINVLAYSGGAATFGGQSVDTTAVLVKYTWRGDATLNGAINGDDFYKIDNGFGSSLRLWENGDFDLNGSVNADDYFLIDSIYNKSTGPLT